MRIFVLKTCDRCRLALREIRAAGLDPQVIDVRADGVSPDDLARFLAVFGAALVNRRSTTWRALSEDARAGDPLALLRAHPTLMKRPVIEKDGVLHLGWDQKVKESLLG